MTEKEKEIIRFLQKSDQFDAQARWSIEEGVCHCCEKPIDVTWPPEVWGRHILGWVVMFNDSPLGMVEESAWLLSCEECFEAHSLQIDPESISFPDRE